MNAQDLIKACYRVHPAGLKEYALCLFQKCIRDDFGKKYFINIYEYDYSVISRGVIGIKYTAEDQMTTKSGLTFDISTTADSVESVEAFMEDVWVKMDCDYYEKY